MNASNLASLLLESTVPDTDRVMAATAELEKTYYRHPESVLLLIEILSTHGDENLRQQAVVQAARLVPKHWDKLENQNQRNTARDHLVQVTLQEPSAKVRHAKCRLIAVIADLDVSNGIWPELVPSVLALVKSSEAAARQTGSYIMYSIMETNPTLFGVKLVPVLGLFAHLLQDSDIDVRINTMMSVGAMMVLFEPAEDEESVRALHSIIPAMIDVFKAVVENQDDVKIVQTFDVFQQFLAYESSLLGPHLQPLVELMAGLAANRNADDDVRCQALSFLTQTVRYRRMKIQAMPDMGKQLTQKSMLIVAELDDDDDCDDNSPARCALTLLEQLASELPPRQVIVPLLDALPNFARSDDPGNRKACILALGSTVQGAPDFITTQLKTIMPHVIVLLNDPDVDIRRAALIGLTHLADNIPDDVALEHDALLTALVKNLEAATSAPADERLASKNLNIIKTVCGALDAMSEGLKAEAIRPYAVVLVDKIGSLVRHDDVKIKVAAAGALAAMAESLGEEFKPHFQNTVEVLGPFLSVKHSQDDIFLRSGIMDALGRVASAVGAETFTPYLQAVMDASEEGLHLDSARLRESSFILWSSLAKMYEAKLAPFLPRVFKGLFESLERDEEEEAPGLSGQDKEIVGMDDQKMHVKNLGDIVDEDEMQSDDEDDWDDIGVTPQALEKEVAVDVLADIMTHSCGTGEMQTYLSKTLELVAPFIEHTYEGCRKASLSSLWRIYARVWQLWEEETGTSWEPGLPLKQTPNANIVALGQVVAQATLKIWADDADRSVIIETNRAIASTLKSCGPAILVQEDMLSKSITMLGTIMTRCHPCQLDLGDEDDEQDVEGTSENDWLVIDTALDVVIGLAAALGTQFSEVWKVFEKPILKFASSSESIERSTGVGVLAECAAHMGADVTPHTGKLLAILLKRLSDTDDETRSNAAYATGQLVLNSNDSNTYLPQYSTIMQKLEPMLHTPQARMRDNATGCICRMIMAHPNRVPLGEVLPVMVDMLPLKEDFEENKPVYQCIYTLYENNDPTMQQLTPRLIPVLEKVLSPPEEQIEDETRLLIYKMVVTLHGSQPELFHGHEELATVAHQALSA